jgi:hypothetical protein
MKTKLIADFAKNGETNNLMLKMICTHNEKGENFSLKELKAILKGKKAEMPSTLKKMKVVLNDKNDIMEVYEDGDSLTYSIQENEYYLLKDTDSSNLDKQIAGEDALLLNPIFDRNNI